VPRSPHGHLRSAAHCPAPALQPLRDVKEQNVKLHAVNYLAVILAVLFISRPTPARAGCDIQSTAQSPKLTYVHGSCSTSTDAQQACINLVAGLEGYTADDCSLWSFETAGIPTTMWGGGWWCVPKAPIGTCPSGIFYFGAFYVLRYYASAHPLPLAQCGNCNGVSDPINPANSEVYTTEVDIKDQGSALTFRRFYNSSDTNGGDLGAGWRHSFGRSIRPKYSSLSYQPYQQTNPDNSYTYADAATACTNGFASIRARISTWLNATASYVNGVCLVSQNGVNVGTLPLFVFQSQTPSDQVPIVNALVGPTLTGFDVTRDDGQLVSFFLNGSAIVAPPAIGLRLQQTGNGYTVTDESDNVETYDANGTLLSVTGRAGVVQTMSYDGSGRLSSVTDSFGHSLTLSYDTQGRLASVARQ
jgi:YD repeat-containing protein